MNKISMWTSFLWDISPEEALAGLADTGWTFAELSHEHTHVLLERGPGAGRAFREAAARAGVSVEQGHLDLNADIAPSDEPARKATLELVKRQLDLFRDIGIRAAVIHPGGWNVKDAGRRLEVQSKSLAELLAHVRGTGIVICLENCCSGAELAPLLAGTDPEALGVCLDTGHLNLAREDQRGFIRGCGGRLRALHLSDNDGSGDQHRFFGPGSGTVPLKDLAAALAESGYRGLYNFELPGENRCSLEERRLKLVRFRAEAGRMFG